MVAIVVGLVAALALGGQLPPSAASAEDDTDTELKVGPLPINTSLAAYSNAENPSFASDWQLRLQVQLLLPGFN